MAAKVTIKGNPPISQFAHSAELSAQLRPLAEKVFAEVKRDTNEFYVKTARIKEHHSRGKRGRVSWRVGVAPIIGLRVEAIRGTMRRALGLIK